MFRSLALCAALGLCALPLAAHADLSDPSSANELQLPGPLPPLVSAQPPPLVSAGEHWGVISATTNAPGHDVLSVEVGFPGVSFGYSHAISDSADWGVRVDVLYGGLDTTSTQFGMAARLPLRKILAHNSRLSLLVHVDPGIFGYAAKDSGVGIFPPDSAFGALIPVGAALGVQPISDLRLSFGVDLPMAIQFLHTPAFWIGPQFGFTIETYLDKNISVGLNLRFGPMFATALPGNLDNPQLGFISQVTLGYRL